MTGIDFCRFVSTNQDAKIATISGTIREGLQVLVNRGIVQRGKVSAEPSERGRQESENCGTNC